MGPELWLALGLFSAIVVVSFSLFCRYGLKLGAPDTETQENNVHSDLEKNQSDNEVLKGLQEKYSHNSKNMTTNYSAQVGSSIGIISICLILATISYFIYNKYKVIRSNPVGRNTPAPRATVVPHPHVPIQHPGTNVSHYNPAPTHQPQYERNHPVQNLHTNPGLHPCQDYPVLHPPMDFPYPWWNPQNPTFLQNIKSLSKLQESSEPQLPPGPSFPLPAQSPSADQQDFKVNYIDIRGLLEEQNIKSEEIKRLNSEKDSLMIKFAALRGSTP